MPSVRACARGERGAEHASAVTEIFVPKVAPKVGVVGVSGVAETLEGMLQLK